MREQLSDTLRRTLDLAQTEARELNQEFITTEHLALALARQEGTGEAGQALQAAHVQPQALRTELLRNLPKGESPPLVTGNLPLSPRAQQTINNALVRAQSLGEVRLSTRILLLALLDEPPAALHEAIRNCGGDLDELTRRLGESPQQSEP